MTSNYELEMRQRECEICDCEGSLSCGFCEEVFYCSKEHKKKHWKEHCLDCKCYKITRSPEAGQYLVASRDIIGGKLIFKEQPIALGPLSTSDLICLACHAPIDNEDFYKCPGCSWPMCSLECASNKNHDEECDVLALDKTKCGVPQNRGQTPRYDLILILRCLLQHQLNPHMWKTMLSMASHWEEKKKEKDPYQNAAVRYFTEICNVNLDEETVQYIRGVIITNAIQIRGPKGEWIRALYPTVRLFNHSCIPNVHLSNSLDGVMEIRSAINIKRGENICISYIDADSLLWERQACISENHYFNCLCERCQDPSELGTLYSNPRCSFCPDEFMIPTTPDGCLWTCRKCKAECTKEEIIQELDEWSFRLEMNEIFGTGTPHRISYALTLIEQHFHIKHFIWVKAAKMALRKMSYDTNFASTKLKKYIWENLLEVYDVLVPGFTNRRGMTMLELAKVTLALASEDFLKNDETSEILVKNYLLDAKTMFEKSYEILKNEPNGTIERSLADTIPSTIMQISEKLDKQLKSTD